MTIEHHQDRRCAPASREPKPKTVNHQQQPDWLTPEGFIALEEMRDAAVRINPKSHASLVLSQTVRHIVSAQKEDTRLEARVAELEKALAKAQRSNQKQAEQHEKEVKSLKRQVGGGERMMRNAAQLFGEMDWIYLDSDVRQGVKQWCSEYTSGNPELEEITGIQD